MKEEEELVGRGEGNDGSGGGASRDTAVLNFAHNWPVKTHAESSRSISLLLSSIKRFFAK